MHINQEGLNLIKSFEGLRLDAYQDVAGIWTIGYGHIKGVKEGMTISEAEAEALLREDLADAENAVSRFVKVPISENEFSALVSLVFNIGSGAFAGSTVLRKLNAGDHKGAADAILMWNRSTVGGKKVVVQGLVRRREAERSLFLKAVPTFLNQEENASAGAPETGNAATRPSAAAASASTAPPAAEKSSGGGLTGPLATTAGGGAAAGGSAVAVSHPDNPFVQWMSNTFGPYTDQILIAVAVITVLVALYVLYRTFFSSPETAH